MEYFHSAEINGQHKLIQCKHSFRLKTKIKAEKVTKVFTTISYLKEMLKPVLQAKVNDARRKSGTFESRKVTELLDLWVDIIASPLKFFKIYMAAEKIASLCVGMSNAHGCKVWQLECTRRKSKETYMVLKHLHFTEGVIYYFQSLWKVLSMHIVIPRVIAPK